MTRASSPGSRPGLTAGSPGRWLAPTLSVVGLLIVAFFTLNLLNGQLPLAGGSTGNGTGNGNGNGNGNAGPDVTPAPSNKVVIPEEVVSFKGTIVYVKAGNVWVQTGDEAHQLTSGGRDSMPSWSPDGSAVYFIRTTESNGRWPAGGAVRDYQLLTPAVMRVSADGSGEPEMILNGKVNQGGRTWHSWIREPVLSPDGRTLAMVSDRPDPTDSDVVLQFYDLNNKKSKVPNLSESPPLGHQDPDWRFDGKELLYVRNGRSGPRGTPAIWRWNVTTSKGSPLTGPGYLAPSYSPDGKYVAATKTSNFGNDVVILDARDGRELLRVTSDGGSWSPTWSPIGDSIAFLHIKGQIIDLKLARLDGPAGNWTIKDITSLTEVSGLDGESRPDWFIPAADRPVASPVPSAAPSSSPVS